MQHTRPAYVHAPRRRAESSDQALADLRFIRETMERSGSFTAVPGKGGILMGATALVAAWIASRQTSELAWMATWFVEAVVAVLIGGWALARKARHAAVSLLHGPGRRFLLGLGPPVLAGAVLTPALYRVGQLDLIPGTWLLLYGVGVITGGAVSARIIPAMGLCFMALGGLACFGPEAWYNECMAAGFGGLHIAFGIVIARKYGG